MTPHPSNAVVFYHAHCMDGFASAWAFHHQKAEDYERVNYVPVSYGDDPFVAAGIQLEQPDFDIFILDFSFPRHILLALSTYARTVLVLDHHKTAQAELENWDGRPDNCKIIFDMNRSGCLLTWEHLYLNSPPALVRYVNDRDLWKFQEHDSKEVNAVVAITPMEFHAYDVLAKQLTTDFSRVSDVGTHLLFQHQKICEEIVKIARPITIGESHGLAANCTPQFSSEVGNLLAKKSKTFGATYFSDSNGQVKWSLRSIGDYDVSSIAAGFGGGGHRNAAGFVVHLNLEAGVDPGRIVLSTVGV